MSSGESLEWYAIWTKSRHERVVRDELERRGFESFLPTITRWSRWKDRKKRVEWPLFPGYCFAKFAPADRLAVLKCTGAAGIVAFDGVPAPVAPGELAAIRLLVESELKFDPCPLIREGDEVLVVHGPLKGVRGHLTRKGAHARLLLSVRLIGQGVSVEVDAADIAVG